MDTILDLHKKVKRYLNETGKNAFLYSTLFMLITVLVGGIHVILMLVFLCNRINELAVINAVSCFIYIACFFMAKKKQIRRTYYLICGEVFAFTLLMSYLVGRNYMFNMYCLATIPFTYLTFYIIETDENGNGKKIYPFINCFIAILLYFLEQDILWKNHPYAGIMEKIDVIGFLCAFNTSVNIICSIIGGISLSSVALTNIKQVRRNMKQIEELAHEAEESNKAKSTFLANMSHEIRTPMNAICGMTDMLLDEELSEQGKEYANSIKSASTSLLSIINDILDFSKLESGKMVIVPEEYYISSVLHDLMNMMEIRVKGKPVKLEAKVQDIIPRKLYGDSGRIRQILINIMGNATKFTQEGTITLSASWMPIDSKTGTLQFAVTDTGVGIKEEDLNKLFNAFEQVDIKKNKGIEGTGLGLSICKLLVEQMGGKIWVESEYGKGSTFRFYIKQEIRDAAPCEYGRNVQRVEVKQFEVDFKAPTAKVMVVDDMKINLRVAAGILKKFNIVPDLVESGIDCVELIKKKKDYDLIFMDHMMPETDGIEATGMIRALHEEYTDNLPVIALSANAVKGMETEFKAGGMNDFIPKPIEVEQLAHILEKWLPQEKIEKLPLDK